MHNQPNRSLLSTLNPTNWPITAKLSIALVVVALLPAFVVILLVTQNIASVFIAETRRALTSMASQTNRVLRENLSYFIETVQDAYWQDLLREMLNNPTDESLAAQVSADFVGRIDNSGLDEITLFNAGGIGLISTYEERLGKRLSEPFLEAALRGEIGIEGLRFDRLSFLPSLAVAVPIRSDDGSRVIGAIAQWISGSQWEFLLADTLKIAQGESGVLQESEMYIVDANGLVLLHSTPNDPLSFSGLGDVSPEIRQQYGEEGALGLRCPPEMPACAAGEEIPRGPLQIWPAMQPVADAARRALQSGTAENFQYCRAERLDQPYTAEGCAGALFSASAVPFVTVETSQALFAVFAEVPERSIFARIDAERGQGLVILFSVAVVAVIGALILGGGLSRPLRRLAQAMSAMRDDQPLDQALVGPVATRGDELGRFAQVLNRTVNALNVRNRELRTIYEIGTHISENIDLQATLGSIVTTLRQIIPYDWAEISLYDKSSNTMNVQLAADADSLEPVNKLPVPADQGYLKQIMGMRIGLLIPQSSQDADWQVGRGWGSLAPRSYLGVPLKVRNEVIGVIEMISSKTDGFNADHLRVVESIAVQAAVALQNAQVVKAREDKLRQEIHELRIEIDEAKKTAQVEAITETEYFKDLQNRVGKLRARKTGQLQASDAPEDEPSSDAPKD